MWQRFPLSVSSGALPFPVYRNFWSNPHRNRNRYNFTWEFGCCVVILGSSGLNGESQRTNSKTTFYSAKTVTFRLKWHFVTANLPSNRRKCTCKGGSGDIWGGDVRPRRQAVNQSTVAVVIRDVIKGSTRSSTVTSSKVLRGVELVSKVSFGLPVKPLATIHANFV